MIRIIGNNQKSSDNLKEYFQIGNFTDNLSLFTFKCYTTSTYSLN